MVSCKFCKKELDLSKSNSRSVRCKLCKRTQYVNNEMLADYSTSDNSVKKRPIPQQTVTITPAEYSETYPSARPHPLPQSTQTKKDSNSGFVALCIVGILAAIIYIWYNPSLRSVFNGLLDKILGPDNSKLIDNDEDEVRTDFTLFATSANEGVSVIDTSDPRIHRSQ